MMRSALVLSSVAIAASLLGACGESKFIATAKGVTGASGTAPGVKSGLTGHWELVESPAGINSHRAGACLFQSLSDFTGTHDQCQDFKNASDCDRKMPEALKSAGYVSACSTDTNTCWVRPENEGNLAPAGTPLNQLGNYEPYRRTACNRSVDYEPLKQWDVGKYVTNEVPATPPKGRKSHWRVKACLVTDEGECWASWGPVMEVAASGVSNAETHVPPDIAKPVDPHPDDLTPVMND